VSYVDHPYEELGVYALDALEPGERRIIEAHLAICAQCTAEVATHRAVLAALTEDEPPPPAIWARIARDIGADDLPTPLPSGPARRDTLRPYPVPPAPGPPPYGVPPGPPPEQIRPSHLRPRGADQRRRWAVAAAAVAAVAVLVVGAVALVRRGETGADLTDVAQSALEAPGASVATLSSDAGAELARVVVDGQTGYVFVDDLPPLPAGQEYQLWKLDGPQPVSLGMVGDGTREVSAVGVPAQTATFAISAEPAAGSVQPTPGKVVASGKLS
jgi:anti-sigma-K factor RskA